MGVYSKSVVVMLSHLPLPIHLRSRTTTSQLQLAYWNACCHSILTSRNNKIPSGHLGHAQRLSPGTKMYRSLSGIRYAQLGHLRRGFHGGSTDFPDGLADFGVISAE